MLLSLFSHPVMSDSLWLHGLQPARPPYPSLFPGVCQSSCPFHQWCHPAISASEALIPFCPQSFPALGTFSISWLFVSGDQNTGTSSSASVLPMNIQSWFPLRLPALISYCPRNSQESSPTPQFKGINSLLLCLLYSPALTTEHDHWEDYSLDYMDLLLGEWCLCFQHTV